MKIIQYMRLLAIAFFMIFVGNGPLSAMELIGEDVLREGEELGVGVDELGTAEIGGADISPEAVNTPEEFSNFKEQTESAIKEDFAQFKEGKIGSVEELQSKISTDIGESFKENVVSKVADKELTATDIDLLSEFNGPSGFSSEDIANLKSLEAPEIGKVEGVEASPESIGQDPSQTELNDFVNDKAKVETATQGLDGASTSQDIEAKATELNEKIETMNKSTDQLVSSREAEVNVSEENVVASDKEVAASQEDLTTAQQSGNVDEVNNAQDKVEETNQKNTETKEEAEAKKVQTAEENYKSSKDNYDTQKKAVDTLEKKLKEMSASDPEYATTQEELDTAKTNLADAEDKLVSAKEKWEKVAEASKTGLQKAGDWFKNNILHQGLSALVFMVPSWLQQVASEAMTRKALLNTLYKNQQFGKIYMTLPRCFINEGNPTASFYMYAGLEAANKDKIFLGSENYLKTPANFYVASPTYGDWGTVAITDPNFPNMMAHLDTGYIFDGDGASADKSCPTAQLIGGPLSGNCSTIVQNKLDVLSSPAAATGSAGDTTTGGFILKAMGYKGSPTIEALLDSSVNTDWKRFYPDVRNDDHASLRYGSLLNPAMGTFRSKTTVGGFQLQEIQGLGKDLGKIGLQSQSAESQAEGGEKKPYVAPGIWIYQTQDTPQLKTVLNQLHAEGEADLAAYVWDYVIALDDVGAIVPLHNIQIGENGFQHYGFNPSQTKVKYLCSLLQPGILGGTQDPFQIYELDGNMWTNSANHNFSNPLTAKSNFTSLFNQQQEPGLTNQVKLMYDFIKDRIVSGPFTIGSRLLEISPDLLAAKLPIYKIANFLADGSDDYVVAVSWPPNILTLPDVNAKYLWSLVTSRVYQPGNFAPNAEQWYAKISGDGSNASPYHVGFSNKAAGGFPYKVPLYSVIMPQDVNPNIVSYNNTTMHLPAPDLYAAKILPIAVGNKKQTIEQVLTASDAPAAAKNVWKAINKSFASWKAFLVGFEDQQKGALNDASLPRVWVADAFPQIELFATSEADIINGFYVYKSQAYPGEFLVMATSTDITSTDLGKEFDTTNPQQYTISLSTGNIYDGKNEGKLLPAAPLNVATIWQQVQTNAAWASRVEDWQSQLAIVQGQVQKLKGADLAEAQAELAMFQQQLALVSDPVNPTTKVPQIQANFNKLQAAVEASQKAFGSMAAASEYGNNLFGPFNLFINKTDIQNRSYFYQDVTNIDDPLSKLDADGDVKGVANYYVCGQTQKDGSVIWGYPLDGDADRILSLITGAVFSRGGFQGTYATFTQAVAGAQVTIDDYFNNVLAEIKDKFGVTPRAALTTAMQSLLAPYAKMLEDEKAAIVEQEEAEKTEYALMDANLMANLKGASYIAASSTLSQQYLKLYAGKYYLVSPDDSGAIVSFTDYNVGVAGKDNDVGATYDSKGNMLVRASDWVLANMRANVGVVVSSAGVQSLALGVNQPMLPMQEMVKLATVPAGSTAKVEDAVLKTEVETALTAYAAAAAAVQKAPQDQNAQEQAMQAATNLALNKCMYRSAQMLNVAVENGYIKPAKGWTYEFYFNKQTGSHFGKIIPADASTTSSPYYLELASGLSYELDGSPRVRKLPTFTDSSTKLTALTWFEGETKHRQLLAVLPSAATGGTYNVYRKTVAVPPASYVPTEGQAGVSYNGESAIQQKCTNILDPDDDKMVVTNDYVRGSNQNVALLDVWDIGYDDDYNQVFTTIGSFKPSKTSYFAHLAYIQTRSSGQTSGMFDPKNVNDNDNITTVMIWNGGSDMKLQQLYYQYQFVTLSASGSNAFTGTYTDVNGKQRSITVTKQQKLIAQSGPAIVAQWISIQDGNKVFDYHYDTSVIEQTALNQLKKLWGINVVTDVYGQSRLSVKFTSLKHGLTVTNVPSVQQTIVNQALAQIGFDGGAKRYLYKLTDQVASYGLESYDSSTMNGWYVDMLTGVLFDLNDYPVGRSLLASDMSKLMDNLKVGVTTDQEGTPTGLHFRNATDLTQVSTPK